MMISTIFVGRKCFWYTFYGLAFILRFLIKNLIQLIWQMIIFATCKKRRRDSIISEWISFGVSHLNEFHFTSFNFNALSHINTQFIYFLAKWFSEVSFLEYIRRHQTTICSLQIAICKLQIPIYRIKKYENFSRHIVLKSRSNNKVYTKQVIQTKLKLLCIKI